MVLRVGRQELLIGPEAFDQALAVVQAVDPDDQPTAQQSRNDAAIGFGRGRRGRGLFDLLDVHADRKHLRADMTAGGAHRAVGEHGIGTPHRRDGGMEAVKIIASLKTDEVVRQQ